MTLNQWLPFLKNPDTNGDVEFTINGDHLVERKTGKSYPIIANMIDFQLGVDKEKVKQKPGILFKLNTLYSNRLDTSIRESVFAGGGVIFQKANRKMKQWIERSGQFKTLFIEPEDGRLVEYIGRERCLTVEDFSAKNIYSPEDEYPNLNASPEQLPIKTGTFHTIVSNYVLEHIRNPRLHMREVARILKPGGYIILSGPGDIYPSHRVPHNYFNVIRYGYWEMFKENGLELVEEHFPAKSWMSILYIIYTTTVRNSWFNKNQFTKLLQVIALGVSVVISPLFNLLALLLDLITPFDQRGYAVYLALLRKPVNTPNLSEETR